MAEQELKPGLWSDAIALKKVQNEKELINSRKALTEVETAKACMDAAMKIPDLEAAGMKAVLPKVCDKYVLRADQDKAK